MSSVVVKKEYIAFISAPATKRVERLLKAPNYGGKLARLANPAPGGRATEECRRALDLAVAIKKPGRSAGKPLRYVLGRGRPRWVPASRAPRRALARPAGGLSEFPPPWAVEETDACFIVRDAHGQAPAYVY